MTNDASVDIKSVLASAKGMAEEAKVIVADAIRIVEREGLDPMSPEGRARLLALVNGSIAIRTTASVS